MRAAIPSSLKSYHVLVNQISSAGTVVVGTVDQGILKKGDKVEIKGDGKDVSTVASDIQVFGKSVKEVSFQCTFSINFLSPLFRVKFAFLG